MKTLMDRCNKYHKNEKLKGKLVFTVGVGGSTEPTEMINSLNKFY
jgi:multimeric flavodoxin WrbA